MIYAIGDIHGELTKLNSLLLNLAAVGMTDADTLVFIGDYVDRGPNVCGVLDLMIELQQNRPNTIFLRGNHEQMMLDARKRYDSEFDSDNPAGNCQSGLFWHSNGGLDTLRSYRSEPGTHWSKVVPKEHWNFMRSTVLQYDDGVYTFVHAGLLPKNRIWEFAEFDTDPRLWIREQFIASESNFGGQIVVFGHTPLKSGQPIIMWNKVGIDTGAVYGGPLTAVGLQSIFNPKDVLIIRHNDAPLGKSGAS